MSVNKLAVSLSLGCIAALTLSACGQQPSTASMQRPPQQVVVVTLKAQPVTLTRELPGRTVAFLIAEVRPQVTGIVKRRLFTEGGRVKAGEALYELDDAIYRAQYNNAQATLQRAQTVLDAARLTSRRSQELIKIDAVSAQDNENAVAAERQAEADVAASQAALQSAAVNLGYARIASPISGRIGKSSVTQGALVTADQATALATVQQLDPIYVEVTQSSGEWLRLQQDIAAGHLRSSAAGAPVKILLEDNSAYAHDGQLQFSDVTVDPTTGSYLLRAIVPNADSTLLPGMYVKAVVNEGVVNDGILAPQQGITHDPKGNATALVVGADGTVQERTVKATRTVGDQWLIEEGLAAGDRLIVEGLQKVQPGMPVQALERGVSTSVPTPVAAVTAVSAPTPR